MLKVHKVHKVLKVLRVRTPSTLRTPCTPRTIKAMFERRLYFHIDWALVAAILLLCALGVAMIYSSTAGDPTRGNSKLYLTQIYGIVLGLGAMTVMSTREPPAAGRGPLTTSATSACGTTIATSRPTTFPPLTNST